MTLGLDELIIVNPGTPPGKTSWFLGADGSVYRLEHPRALRHGEASLDDTTLAGHETVPRFFLGDDGVVYERR